MNTANTYRGITAAVGPTIAQLRAERGRRTLLAFVMLLRDGYMVGLHHKVICEKLTQFIQGKIKRLMIFVPPQHGKSELSSRYFPAWALGLMPDKKIALASYSDELAGSFNMAVQRIIDTDEYRAIFPNTVLNGYRPGWGGVLQGFQRNRSIFEVVGNTGSFRALGIGGPLTGQPVDIGIIDDPVKDRITAESESNRKMVWNWYTDVFLTRLHNKSQQLLLMCMAGDTPVLMPDGSEKPIKDIKPGESIATYDAGRLTTSKVLGWKNQGSDFVFEIRMKSGIIVKANERHPFLVYKNNETQWIRLKDLKPGNEIVRMMPNGAQTRGLNAPLRDAVCPQNARGIAAHTIIKPDGQADTAPRLLMQPLYAPQDCVTATESDPMNTTQWQNCRAANVPFAGNCQTPKTPAPIGPESSALTIATKPGKLGVCSATIATLPLGTAKQNQPCCGPLNTCDFTTDSIVEIVAAGREDVFDIQVERTENFIANGLVSHNTRWHEDDLAGRLLKQDEERKQQGLEPYWEVIEFPAIKETEPNAIDPRQIGEPLWPEKHDLDTLAEKREAGGERSWESLYQQHPTAAKGNIIKVENFKEITWDEFVALHQYDYIEWGFKVDGAYTAKTINDATALYSSWFCERLQRVYVRQVISVRLEFDPLLERLTTFVHFNGYGPFSRIKVEPKANGITIVQSMQRNTSLNVEEYKYPKIEGVRMDDRDKITRAIAITPKVDAGRVWLIKGDWNKTFKAQCASFPLGKNDDEVDVLVMDLLEHFFAPKAKNISSNT